MLATITYAFTLHYAHRTYLNSAWEYYGFSFRAPGPEEVTFALLMLAMGAAWLPLQLTRPSSIVLLCLFVVVYVPTTVITIGLDTDWFALYGISLAVLAVSFAVVCLLAGAHKQRTTRPEFIPGNGIYAAIVSGWAICCAVLLYRYSSVMTFVGLAEIYDQRAAGASTSVLMGYVQTYFSNVFSPALIALGLLRRDWKPVALGTAGCMMMYMINAQRTVFLLPFALIGLHFLLRSRITFFRSPALLVLLVSGVVLCSAAYYEKSIATSLLATYLVFRTVGLPGLSFSQYHDLFAANGFTYWSHVKGLSLVVPAPDAYASESLWPNLGLMVGDRIYGNMENNASANLFAGDGVAAAGALGVAVIAVLLLLWLVIFDKASRGWNRQFVVLVSLPMGLTLTNGHFFTMLLSFGGLFWLLVFSFYRPTRLMSNGGTHRRCYRQATAATCRVS